MIRPGGKTGPDCLASGPAYRNGRGRVQDSLGMILPRARVLFYEGECARKFILRALDFSAQTGLGMNGVNRRNT
jgi:hypothetical protein